MEPVSSNNNHWQRYAADLSTVLRLSEQLAGGIHALDQLLNDIVDAAKELSGADRCSLFLINKEHGFLWTSVAHGSGTITVPLGVGVAGTVAATGESINISDAYQDDRFDQSIDQRTGYRTRAMLSLPLKKHDNEVVGVIQALNKHGDQQFTAYDTQLLAALGGQAAVAIDNAQLIESDRNHQQIKRDLELARQIQEALQPQSLPDSECWHFAAWQQSCDEVGGDFYDFLTTDDDMLDSIIADVSGHGIGAALVVNTARSSIRALHGTLPNDHLLSKVNDLLEQDLGDESFLTLLMSRFLNDGSIKMVSCGHEPPFVLRRATNCFDEINEGGLILGVMPGIEYQTTCIDALQDGDRIVMATDGFFEAEILDGSNGGSQWGIERMQESIRHYANRSLAEMVEGIVSDLVLWRGSSSFDDDLTIIAAEYHAP